MGEMRSSRRTGASIKSSAQLLTDHNIGTELKTAWKSLDQSKAALRHIENRLEATPGTGVLLDSVSEPPKKKVSITVCNKDGQGGVLEGSSKPMGGNQQSPAKRSSRSPFRNTTLDSNVRKSSCVEFREPLASYREATPPSRPFSQLETYNLQSVPGSSYASSPSHSDHSPSQLVYQRNTRDRQTDRDLDSTHSSALESAEVRYLNDQSALDILKTEENAHKTELGMDESSPFVAPTPGSSRQEESTPSTSPGSASQRLENLKRHQPDDKLEKLKARIRRQRKHLEEAADREKLQSLLEKPIAEFVESDSPGVNKMPTAKIRKVTSGPPAPIYKGFNRTETKIKTSDGKVWNEEDFHNFSREISRDMSHNFPESSRSKHQQQRERRAERSSEKRPSKPVRKVHKVPPVSDRNSKPVISPASWKEGQKLIKMVLGPGPGLPREEHSSQPAGRLTRTDSRHCSERTRSSRPNSTERPKEQPISNSTTTYKPLSSAQEKTPLRVNTDLLSADTRGLFDDLQLDCEVAEKEERARKRSRGGSVSRRGRGGSGSRTRTPVSTWGTTAAANTSSRGCRSASPTTRQSDTINTVDKGHKGRHYDPDTVRQYIVRQQEERKRRQAEEKRAMKEEAERRNQRLQELYKKQKEVAKTIPLSAEALVAPFQKRLQETYTKLLQEDTQLNEEMTERLSAPSIQLRPAYQPSGESDKENKRLEVPQSPSSSDKSLNELPPPPLSRNDLDVVNSFLLPDHLHPPVQPTTGPSCITQAPSNEHLLSQLLRLEAAVAASNIKYSERPATAPAPYSRSQTKMSRIEALKATATSLSNRIEREARKFAVQEVNYGAATSVDVDTILSPRISNLDQCWTETITNAAKHDDMTPRMHEVLTSTGSYMGTALLGAGNLHDLREKKEKRDTGFTNPHKISVDVNVPAYKGFTLEKSRIVGGLENNERTEKAALKTKAHKEDGEPDLHNSSAGSISEGPLLSEGSFSEDEASPRHCSDNPVPLSDRLGAKDYCASQRKNQQRLLDFQREAAMCSPFSPFDSSKTPWEELNKGSPLSVINIFTKNAHGHVQAVSKRNSEVNSPPANSSHSGNSPGSAAVYEDDLVSSHNSKTSDQRGSNSPSCSQHLCPGSTPGSSPISRHLARIKGTTSDQSDTTLVEEQRSSPSEVLSSNGKKRRSDKRSSPTQVKSVHSDSSGETSGHSPQRPRRASPPGSPEPTPQATDSLRDPFKSGSLDVNNPNINTSIYNGVAGSWSTGELQYSPAVLQQRMTAELQYLESIEESFKQIGDIERLMGVSMAQLESASLAQMLKTKQQHHERELYELKIKAEREAFETKLQLEENRQRVARAHIELQESLAASQKESLEVLQESTSKMMSQQAEATRHTAETARHIKEMTELARSQIAGTSIIPPVNTDSALMDQRREHKNSKPQDNDADSDSEVSSQRTRSEEPLSSIHSPSQSDSLSFRRPNLSVSVPSSSLHSPSYISSGHREQPKKEASSGKPSNGIAKERLEREAASSSVEEDIPSAANGSLCSESIHSVVDEKDATSVATEYSFKFEESMTEDEIEERSFRSLLPSEAHRRGTMEKKLHQNVQAEDDGAIHNSALMSGTESHSTSKFHNAHIAFSGGQDSFSQFTMEMVRQYMKDEEVRLQHQSSLLHLRQKALKEKTRTELAWLEHQKKKFRDKGEDDKMPPIRKKQRGLLLKLQQEQAEIKHLQEANKAARKERQLLLKQQEEIERMRNSTLRLKERLKCAGGQTPPETPVSELAGSEPASPNNLRLEAEMRSPSPSLSISGSETSSIMQKLKKMRSHMDEKFLTKREQQLIQRRHHAEELLQWKQRLDQEEAEVRRMEKEALAVWEQKRARDEHQETSESQGREISEIGSHTSQHQSFEAYSDSEKDHVSEGSSSSVTSKSTIHTEGPGSEHVESPSAKLDSVSETPLSPVQSSPANYTQDFSSESQPSSSKPSLLKASHSPAASPAEGSNKTKMQLHSPSRTQSEVITQLLDSPTAVQSENISDQSNIESRIKALKEELRKRKLMAYQLKKEQKKRHKERLKAQEASLLKQLQNCNNFIEKTQAELNKELDSVSDTSSQINVSNSILEQSSIKPPPHRSEARNSSDSDRTLIDASFNHNASHQAKHSTYSEALPEDLFYKEEPSTPGVSVHSRPENGPLEQKIHEAESPLRPSSKAESEQKNVTDLRSNIEEELEVEVSSKSEDEHSHHLLKLEKEYSLDSQASLSTTKHVSSVLEEELEHSGSARPEQDTQAKRSILSEAEKAVLANSITSGEPHSSAVDLDTFPHGKYSSVNDHTHSDSAALFSNKKTKDKDSEASPIADGYYDDFESTCSSPREDNKFKPESQISYSHNAIKFSNKDSSSREPTFDNQEEVVEEEIEEELSRQSGVSDESHLSERLLDLNQQREDVKRDNKGTYSSLQTPPPPVKDEMPSFDIGNRVLVGGVQPGTLRFKGPTSFANGFWAGVELDKSEGSNNGTYDGVVYFKCKECHGIFAPPDKIAHLPDKYERYADTAEDEDSFHDDLFDKGGNKQKNIRDNSPKQGDLESKNEDVFLKENGSRDTKVVDEKNQALHKNKSHLNSQHHKESTLLISKGHTEDITLDLEDASHTFLILDRENSGLVKQTNKETAAIIVRNDEDFQKQSSVADLATDIKDDKSKPKDRDLLDTLADTLIKNFVKDTVEQFADIKKVKAEKIRTANQLNGNFFSENNEENWISSIEQKDGLPFFLPSEKEELSSPELCNRPESPMLGASGQEELAKRLAELELSRELVDEFGDDQDWFDEDFGLSSRRKQQRIKQKEEEAKLGGDLGRSASSSSGPLMGGIISSLGGEPQVKTPPRPELPLPLPPKLPEQPAMVVPHSAKEVQKMVYAATQEIWETCDLGREGALAFEHLPNPTPSLEYLCKESSSQDQEAISIRSYRKAVYDLTWEILQEIYTEDPNTDQPQWVKPRQVKSSSVHKVKTSGELNKIQEFVTAEVLKLYDLAEDQNQKSDWQKMLKFGRKKRDRVDHILVQELHEEEAQWVNYDEDELFVKLQLADSIFDALLKDTANAFTLISEKRAEQGLLS